MVVWWVSFLSPLTKVIEIRVENGKPLPNGTTWLFGVDWQKGQKRMLKKGSLVYLEGKLTHRKYQDKNGIDRYITEVVANTFRVLDKREGGSSGNYGTSFPSSSDSPPQGTSYELKSDTTVEKVDSDAQEVDDDLPF